MGKSKKKPFIDKKNASTFHLLHRSQRDVGGDNSNTDEDNGEKDQGSRVILWPSPDNRTETNQKVLQPSTTTTAKTHSSSLHTWKEQMSPLGLVDDYNYDQHLKPITGTGTFVDAGNEVSADRGLGEARSRPSVVADEANSENDNNDIHEVSRQLESIALTPEFMDDDIAQALFGDYEAAGFEEILDDFCVTAAQEPHDEEHDNEEFDYDAHIRSLMERAAKQDRGEADSTVPMEEHGWGKRDRDFFAQQTAIHNNDDENGHYDPDLLVATIPGVVSALSPEEEEALCEKFEATLREYDSDEVGDLDDECEDICGERPLQGDAQVEAALEEFLVEKEDEIFMEGTRHLNRRRQGGSGFSALVGTTMVAAKELDNVPVDYDDEVVPVREVLAEANQVLANPEMEPPPEEVFIDGQSYYSERARNPWDCESILTTYSNLDNNPVTIKSSRRKKKKNRKVSPESCVPEEEAVEIQLSNKTGLPLGVFPSRPQYYEGDDTISSVNLGEARKKNETKEEKKARKDLVKQERQIARIQKKMMKEAFDEEFAKRAGDVIANDVGGRCVFRYS